MKKAMNMGEAYGSLRCDHLDDVELDTFYVELSDGFRHIVNETKFMGQIGVFHYAVIGAPGSGITDGLLWVSRELRKAGFPVILQDAVDDMCEAIEAETDASRAMPHRAIIRVLGALLELGQDIWKDEEPVSFEATDVTPDVISEAFEKWDCPTWDDEFDEGEAMRFVRILSSEIKRRRGKNPVVILDGLELLDVENYRNLYGNRDAWILKFPCPIIWTANAFEDPAKWWKVGNGCQISPVIADSCGSNPWTVPNDKTESLKAIALNRMDEKLVEPGALELAARFSGTVREFLRTLADCSVTAMTRATPADSDAMSENGKILMDDVAYRIHERTSEISARFDANYRPLFAMVRDNRFNVNRLVGFTDAVTGGAVLANDSKLPKWRLHPQMVGFMADVDLGGKDLLFTVSPRAGEQGWYADMAGLGALYQATILTESEENCGLALAKVNRAVLANPEWLFTTAEEAKGELLERRAKITSALYASAFRTYDDIMKALLPMAMSWALSLPNREPYGKEQEGVKPDKQEMAIAAISAATLGWAMMEDKDTSKIYLPSLLTSEEGEELVRAGRENLWTSMKDFFADYSDGKLDYNEDGAENNEENAPNEPEDIRGGGSES